MMALTDRLDLLIRVGNLSDAEAGRVHTLAAQAHEAPDQVLARLGLMSEVDIARAYSEASGLPLLDTQNQPRAAAQFEGLNPVFLAGARIAPLEVTEVGVTVAVADPFAQDALDALAFALERPLDVRVAPAGLIERLNAATSSADPQDIATDGDAEQLRDMASAAPTVRLVAGLIADAVERGASDIHLEPGRNDAIVRQRVDGVLQETGRLGVKEAIAAVSRVKVLCDLDIAEHRRPQDGAARLAVAGRDVDFRVSVVPTDHGESLTLRLLDPDAGLRGLDQLGFPTPLALTLREALDRPNGLVLVTGPTGSGKTTTLYAGLRHLAAGERKILTIEDPIEYRLEGVSQSQINPGVGLDFAAALRSFLRHDPDVIMVGEIRDTETARTAVQAALTGHLVLSTLHTNDAPSAVIRLMDMGVEPYLVASTLAGAFAQRLVRVVCPSCQGKGCPACAGSGYSGRTVVAEGFVVNDTLRAQIREGAGAQALRDTLLTSGWEDLRSAALAKAEAGLTTREEAIRAAGGHG